MRSRLNPLCDSDWKLHRQKANATARQCIEPIRSWSLKAQTFGHVNLQLIENWNLNVVLEYWKRIWRDQCSIKSYIGSTFCWEGSRQTYDSMFQNWTLTHHCGSEWTKIYFTYRQWCYRHLAGRTTVMYYIPCRSNCLQFNHQENRMFTSIGGMVLP